MAKEKAPINKVPAMPHGNPKSLDSSSHIQRVTLKEPHKSISATRKVHIGCNCVRVCVYVCAQSSVPPATVHWHLAHVSHLRAEELTGTGPLESITPVTHTQGLLAHFTITLTVRKMRMRGACARTHTNAYTHTLTFRMNVSSVLLSMTKRTCDKRAPLIAVYEQTYTV